MFNLRERGRERERGRGRDREREYASTCAAVKGPSEENNSLDNTILPFRGLGDGTIMKNSLSEYIRADGDHNIPVKPGRARLALGRAGLGPLMELASSFLQGGWMGVLCVHRQQREHWASTEP